uniref:Uncharacterized protein n=1 Tax=viral metagenome TaxID=1070528 RepID=A0A6C0K9Y5_9ZZZZ
MLRSLRSLKPYMLLAPLVSLFMCYISATTSFIYSSPSIARNSVSLRGSRSPRRNSGGFQNISNYIKNIKPLPPLPPLPKPSLPLPALSPLTLAALAVPEVQSLTPLELPLTPHTMLSLLTLASLEEPEVSSSLTPPLTLPMTKENNNTSGKSQDTSSNNLKIQRYSKENISSIIKNFSYYNTLDDIPLTGDQINITSIYINIEKVKGVYFSKDANNVIFTLQDNLANLYYYDGGDGGIYKISNNTRINMKGLSRFVFQSFNNDVDGILF